jgi:hypothetical protein
MSSSYERAARAHKVSALIQFIPYGATEKENAAVAHTLSCWSQADRDRFAAHHQVNSPSEATWQLLCQKVRARPCVAVAS